MKKTPHSLLFVGCGILLALSACAHAPKSDRAPASDAAAAATDEQSALDKAHQSKMERLVDQNDMRRGR